MAEPKATVVVTLDADPVARAVLDTLDLVEEMLDVIPEWHADKRAELTARRDTILITVMDALRAKLRIGKPQQAPTPDSPHG